MNRSSISFTDKQEENIKNFMIRNNINLKSKAIREIINNYFEYESSLEDLRKLLKKTDTIISLLNIIKSLEEQLYIGMGIRENVNPKDNESLQEFYNSIKKINFMILG